ncbi:MAG: hypothetical protein ACJAZN_000260 [Planctomycetota bacterium]|jgi:hypothetical protein
MEESALAQAQELGLDQAQTRGIALEATRALRSPLASLRVIIEGYRASDSETCSTFADRALEEIDRAEAAAHDVLAWSMPRSLRSTPTTLAEIVQSLRSSLGAADCRRTHFVLEQESTALDTDAPLLVECLARSLSHAYRDAGAQPYEVMVHVHASADTATFSFIRTGEAAATSDQALARLSLSEALLRASVLRLDGKTSIHDAEGHRCSVVKLPLKRSTTQCEEAAQ